MSKLCLYDQKGTFICNADSDKSFDRGGEGFIIFYPGDHTRVIKIYHDHIQPTLSEASFRVLYKLGSAFVRPQQLLYDHQQQVKGYVMDFLARDYTRFTRLFSKNECTSLGISHAIKLSLAQKLVDAVWECHRKDIVLGDLNPYNIYFNPAGDLKILDTDSFATQATQHSGRVLDEVRDFYLLGQVSRQSDMYALAVNIFRMLTFVHPYKGTHKLYKSLQERAIQLLSVLSNDQALVVPAFYEALRNKELEKQFYRIFNQGERFMICIQQAQTTSPVSPVPIKKADNLRVTVVAEEVKEVHFHRKVGYIKHLDGTYSTFYCKQKGMLELVERNLAADHVWLGHESYLVLREGILFKNSNMITNFLLSEGFRFYQADEAVYGVDAAHLYVIHPDRVCQAQVAWTKEDVFGDAIKITGAPLQMSGGVPRLHCVGQRNVNYIKLPVHPLAIKMKGNLGILTYMKDDSLVHQWFQIEGLTCIMKEITEEAYNFATMTAGQNTILVVAKDGRLEFLEATTWKLLEEIKAECTAQTQVFMTQSGILLSENGKVLLLNKH